MGDSPGFDDPLPDLDPVHPCPKCGAHPWAPADGSGRACHYCGWTWQLGIGTLETGFFDPGLLQSGRRHWPRIDKGMPSLFIGGEPPTFMTRAERAWRTTVEAAVLGMWRNPHLEFRVSDWQRGGQQFDLDNLCKPVLDLIGGNARTVWAVVALGEPPGLHIWEEPPPASPQAIIKLDIADPPTRSIKRTMPIREAEGVGPIEGDDPLGLSLDFHSPDVRVADFGFDGPIKAVLDGLGSLFGTYHQGPRDYRVRELRIRSGARQERKGVSVAIWRL